MSDRSITTYTVEVHYDPTYGYEAAVQELPGCFAAGATMDELERSLEESIGLWLSTEGHPVRVQVARRDNPAKPTQERRKVEFCVA